MRAYLILIVCLVTCSAAGQQIVRIGFPTGYGYKFTPGVGSIQFVTDNQPTGSITQAGTGSIFLGFLIPVFSSVATPTSNVQTRQIKVYPNPFEQIIKIENNRFGPYTYLLLDMQGHNIVTGKTADDLHYIHTPSLAPGMYVLRITGTNGTFELHKIIKT